MTIRIRKASCFGNISERRYVMACEITQGMLVKVGPVEKWEVVRVHITTLNDYGRVYERDKILDAGQFLFGTVVQIFEIEKEVKRQVMDEDGKWVRNHEGIIVTELVKPAKHTALIRWVGAKYRASTLPVEMLTPAINPKKKR